MFEYKRRETLSPCDSLQNIYTVHSKVVKEKVLDTKAVNSLKLRPSDSEEIAQLRKTRLGHFSRKLAKLTKYVLYSTLFPPYLLGYLIPLAILKGLWNITLYIKNYVVKSATPLINYFRTKINFYIDIFREKRQALRRNIYPSHISSEQWITWLKTPGRKMISISNQISQFLRSKREEFQNLFIRYKTKLTERAKLRIQQRLERPLRIAKYCISISYKTYSILSRLVNYTYNSVYHYALKKISPLLYVVNVLRNKIFSVRLKAKEKLTSFKRKMSSLSTTFQQKSAKIDQRFAKWIGQKKKNLEPLISSNLELITRKMHIEQQKILDAYAHKQKLLYNYGTCGILWFKRVILALSSLFIKLGFKILSHPTVYFMKDLYITVRFQLIKLSSVLKKELFGILGILFLILRVLIKCGVVIKIIYDEFISMMKHFPILPQLVSSIVRIGKTCSRLIPKYRALFISDFIAEIGRQEES